MARGYKTGGRQKGVSNKVTQDVRELLSDVVYNELGNIHELLKFTEQKYRLDFIIKLLPYIIPRYGNIIDGQDSIDGNSLAEEVSEGIMEIIKTKNQVAEK